ncbi:MAG: 4Fe-4S dicluster domain-containing protein [bacterium]
MKRVYPKEEVCIGCRLCEVACVVEHSKSKDILKAYKRESPRPLPGTRVEERGALSFSLQCRHCEDAPCIEACISGAMHRKPPGVVVVGESRCMGCWTCIMVCPFGAIRRKIVDGGRGIASKCDLCPDREIPACVSVCPNRALVYKEG